jgi:hypothetical protein
MEMNTKKLFFNSNIKKRHRDADECGKHFMSSIPFIGALFCVHMNIV